MVRLQSGLVVFAMLCSVTMGVGLVLAEEKSEPTLHLPFWDQQDVLDPAGGRIDFRAEPLHADGTTVGYPKMQYGCEVPRPDGSAWIYGWRVANWQDRPQRTLEVVRVSTRDGLNFSGEEKVWSLVDKDCQGFANLVRRPSDGALFFFFYSNASVRVYGSDDGSTWRNLTDKAYVDHDAMMVTWYSPWGEFLNYQNTLEPYQKRYPDNIGNLRRVISFRRSKDGVNWESFSPPFLNGEKLWRPDKEDPVDLEFYRSVVFPTQGRYAMLLQDYIAPPAEANSRRATTKHGPRSAVEWALSRDGLNWDRPHRNFDPAEQTGLPVQGPLLRDGKLRFYQPDGPIAALFQGRIFFVTSRGNGEFSTVPFKMPAGGMTVNVNALYRPNEGETGCAYLMAELHDEQGNVIPGYEREKSLIANRDDQHLPLCWDSKKGDELAGRVVRVRFFLREAKLYSLSAAE